MLFRQSLEAHYREDLFQSVSIHPESDAIKPLDADTYIAMSMMQKAVRRSNAYFETLTEHGFDRTSVEHSKLGLSRSGVPLSVFMPLLSKRFPDPTFRFLI